MPKFTFTATKEGGKTVTATLEAADRTAAINTVKSQGLTLVTLTEQAAEKTGSAFFSARKGRVKSDDLVVFTRQLSAMISAGVPIMRSITSMAQHSQNPYFRTVITAVSKDIEGGQSFADALSRHPDVFNDVYVNMVRAGEAAGILDDILKRLALQQEKSASIRKKIKSAMTYPMVLVVITIVAFFGLMIFVIPMIGKTIKDLGGEDAELPAITEIMLSISHFFVNYWYLVFPIIIGIVVAIVRYIKTPGGKRNFHIFMLKAPILGRITRKIAVARFARTFSALIGAGVAVLEALEITARAAGNIIYQEAIQEAGKRVKNGEVLSKVVAEHEDLFPAIVIQMLSVGEETGQTDKVLVKVADFYEEEVDTEIAGISSTIEPLMIVFMGGMIGLIAASVMMPITGLANQIKS